MEKKRGGAKKEEQDNCPFFVLDSSFPTSLLPKFLELKNYLHKKN